MSGAALEAQILGVLSEIRDPDLGKDIVTLGFVKDLLLKTHLMGTDVSFTVELTTPACPIKGQFEAQAQELVAALPGVRKVTVKMTSQVKGASSTKSLPGVKNVIAVGSGKGGVGKSTVAVNLAYALQAAGAKVGLLDADIHGPSLGVMLGLEGMPKVIGGRMQPVVAFGMPVMSFAFFAPVGEATLWRGPQVGKAVEQMLKDVAWPEVDYLVVDLPPGTGDVHLALFHTVDISGAVVVSTPQDVALADALKGVAMFRKMKVPLLGLVENMSGFVCPHCGKTTEIFGQGGVEKAAAARDVPFLGRIPLDPVVVQRGDTGVPLVVEQPTQVVAKAIGEIAGRIAQRMSTVQAMGTA